MKFQAESGAQCRIAAKSLTKSEEMLGPPRNYLAI